jgi:hypothetical protein
VSGHNQLKKDGQRKDKKTQARKRDFEQPIVGAVSPQHAQDTSNFTDGDIAGAGHGRDDGDRDDRS